MKKKKRLKILKLESFNSADLFRFRRLRSVVGRRRGICCEKTLLIPNLLEGNRVYFSQSEKQHSHKMFSAANREVHGEEDVARQYRGPSLSEVRLNRNRIKHI